MRSIGLWFLVTAILSLYSCGGGGGRPSPSPSPPPPNNVDELIQEGKSSLISGDGSSAWNSFQQAINLAPTNPDANVGLAFIDLMRIGNDIVTFLSEANELIFRNVSYLPVSAVVDTALSNETLFNFGRFVAQSDNNDLKIEEKTYQEIREKIIFIVNSLNSILNRLDKALTSTSSLPGWRFSIPKDWNDPSAGTISISRGDLLLFSASLEFILGFLNFSIAYVPGEIGIRKNEFGDVEITGLGEPTEVEDINEDGYIDLNEIISASGFPNGFGMLADDGATRLEDMVRAWRNAFNDVKEGFDSYIQGNELVGHWAFDMTGEDFNDFVNDWDSYIKAYLEDLIQAFENGATLSVRPEVLSDFPELEDDPGTDFSLSVNFAEFFTNLPSDLRNFPIRFIMDVDGSLRLPVNVEDAFPDTEVLGLFPGGLSQENFEKLFGN